MMNHEITKVLAREHQQHLTHSAVIARLARRVRRTRGQEGLSNGSEADATIELPNDIATDAGLPIAA